LRKVARIQNYKLLCFEIGSDFHDGITHNQRLPKSKLNFLNS